ncbi:sensor histidine kinase [Nocardia arizonensis]|uniref:sensor histidine kinase n=1 Tax=Nocardia arizonensis TaxID=1141647 RepID=UPI0006D1D6CF|nr:histidine kinase [Nocardia arizonensis]
MTPAERLRTTWQDAVAAVVLVAAGLVQTAVFPIAPRGIGELYVLASTLPLAWRRTYPVTSALISAPAWLIPLDGFPVLGFVTVILQFYALGAWGRPGVAVTAVTVWASAAAVIGTLLGPEEPVAAIGAVLVVAAPVIAGRIVARLRRQNAEIRALTNELRYERARAEEAAVAAERTRIARELHDVVGHELTLIAIQAEAAASALKLAPDKATAPVEAIRTTAHHTLTSIRQALDVLAPLPDGDIPGDPDLVTVADNARSVGIPNTLTVTGTPPPERGTTLSAVNRILRECLTNAGKHAPGERVDITIDWSAGRVTLHSTNPAACPDRPCPGRGLTGMRHRAELLGGTFETHTDRGRFDITVTIPFETRLR